MTLRVAVTDIETGDSDTAEVEEGDYMLVCHGPCYLAHTQTHVNGTHVLTVKGRSSRKPPSDKEAKPHG